MKKTIRYTLLVWILFLSCCIVGPPLFAAQPRTHTVQKGDTLWDLCEWYDSDADRDAVDLYMIDSSAFTIYQTPIIMRAFWEPKTEHYYWRWKSRGVVLAKPKYNGTDWKKGIVKSTVDIHD